MSSYRKQRLEHRIQEIIASLLSTNHILGAKNRSITIEEVVLAPDYSVAQVFITGADYEKLSDELLQKINRARGYIQSVIAKQLNLRKTPRVTFVTGSRMADAARTLELIERISHS